MLGLLGGGMNMLGWVKLGVLRKKRKVGVKYANACPMFENPSLNIKAG